LIDRIRLPISSISLTLNKEGKCCDEAETARTECGQLQKTEAPERVTRIASLTEDQSDASTWPLRGNYSRGLYLHIPRLGYQNLFIGFDIFCVVLLSSATELTHSLGRDKYIKIKGKAYSSS